MKVKALRPGFYGRRIAAGEVFDWPDDKKLGSWMEAVGDDDVEAVEQTVDTDDLLAEILDGADHEDPDIWTQSGKLRIEFVQELLGTEVTRDMLEAVRPGLVRKVSDQ